MTDPESGTGRGLSLRLVGRPLLKNDRLHWRRHANEVARLKAEAWALCHTSLGAQFRRNPLVTPVTVVGYARQPRHGRSIDHDAIAPSVAAVLDGVVAAGLLADDGPEWVSALHLVAPMRGDAWELYVEVIEPGEESRAKSSRG